MSEIRRTILRKKKVRTPYVQDALIFFVFIIIATAFWFLYAFSKTKETEYDFNIRYKNIPSKYIFSKKAPETIKVMVEDVGFNHFFYSLSGQEKSITIDLDGKFSNSEAPIRISSKDIRKLLQEVLPPNAKVRFMNPKHIRLEYGKLFHKRLAIKLDADLKLYKQYTFRDEIKLKPSEVDVYGTRNVLDTMTAVYTKPLKISDLKVTTFKTLGYNLPDGVRVDPKQVDVTIPVELYTEKTISIPVTSIDAPKYTKVRTFPAFVNITFFVGLSQFDKIKADAFSVFIDYKNIRRDNSGKQKLSYTVNKPLNISNIRLSPSSVEYILEEKYEQ